MTYRDFRNLDLTIFEKGEKITIIKQNDFGYPCAYVFKLDNIFLRDYAQYNNCIQVQGKKPRARKMTAILLKPYDEFAIYRGVVEVKDTSKTISDDVVTRVTSLGMCFDNDTLKNSFPEGSVINTKNI